ncbi:PLP-dependent transferase [Xylariaceae sp. FL0016]|nr:PLP-dependent transferase [Xylariaceae sp. FL0016]
MVKVPAFEVEQWMDKYENTPGVLNIAETCASSITLDQLVQMNGSKNAPPIVDLSARMTYGSILGSSELRENIASTYQINDAGVQVSSQDIIVAQGAISANYLAFYSLIGPGDHVICVYPTYQQLYSTPETLGAEVTLWKLKPELGYIPDVAELKELIKDNTKMIVVNNPNNPTGVAIPGDVLRQIVNVAREFSITVFSDEVYRPLFHSLQDHEIPPSALSMGYTNVVTTGSMSKAWALAGIRVGWVASKDPSIMKRITTARDYTTISVSQLDDQVARYALSPSVRSQLLARNINLARSNLRLLEEFMQTHASNCSWVKPTSGTTAFIEFKKNGEPIDDETFCRDVLDKTKVMFLPGSRCFGDGKDFRGFIRIGYVNETAVIRQALERLSRYLSDNLA